MKIIPRITSTDVLVKCLFNAPSVRVPKNSDSDVVKVLKRETIELDEGTVVGTIECHEKQVSITKNGQTHMVM